MKLGTTYTQNTFSKGIINWSQTQFLEGHSSAQFSSNPNQTPPDPANQGLQDY